MSLDVTVGRHSGERSAGPAWATDYERHLRDLTLSRLRVTSIIVVCVVLLDGGVQLLFMPQLSGELFVVRFAVSLMILSIFGLTYMRSAFRVAFALSLVATLIVAGDAAVAIAATGVYNSPFQPALALLMIAAGLLFPYSPVQMAVSCVPIWAVYLMPALVGWRSVASGGSGFYVTTFLLLVSSLIAVTGSYVISRLRRHEFLSQLALKDTFGKYVTNEVRDEVLSGHIPLDGEKKNVTILFSDLRNFTPMTESHDPKLVIKIMNSYFTEMSEAIRDQGGLVLQFIGDEIYAVFGAPVTRPDHPARAFRAGLDMRRRLADLNRESAGKGWPGLRHGIGIHTGDALAANIGSPDRQSYLLVGDTINVASRIQSLTKEVGSEIVISAATRSRLTEADLTDVELRALGDISLKGKNRPVELFSVV